ncbi:MAG: hypothetical protein ABIJ56_17430 [Pseudomonadota bacterium]
MKEVWITALCLSLTGGCGGASNLAGDGSDADAAPTDPAADEVFDVPDLAEAPDAPDAVDTVADEETVADVPPDGCCAPPMVLNPVTGICVDPTGLFDGCEGDVDACAFGQRCTVEWGEGPLGYFCHIPCTPLEDGLCPERYTCDPVRCCDIPNRECVPDPCEPPLLMHPWTEECVSSEGLGMDCSATESCGGPGQTCLVWQGVDGTDFHTCEIMCERDDGGARVCPNGFECMDMDDGPENVCKPRSDMAGCDDPGALVCGLSGKFLDVTRDSVCPGCYGVVFCVSEGEIDRFSYLFPAGALDCEPPGYPGCSEGNTRCIFPFRSGVDDCPDMMPSDFYWSTVCIAALQDSVQSVRCFWLE